jgi:hypothetical protein
VSINVNHTWSDISGSAYFLPFKQDILSTSFVHRLTSKLALKILKLNFKIIFFTSLWCTTCFGRHGHHQALRNLLLKTAALPSMNTIPKYVCFHLCAHVLCVCSAGWFLLRVLCSCLYSWLFLIFSPHIFGRMEVVVLSIPGLLVARAGGA